LFTQVPWQRVCPALQPVHSPAVQASLDSHFSLHLPQCCGFAATSTQAFPHFTSGAAHWMPHLPAEHTGVPPPVAGQTLPHLPQFLASDARSRHAAPQSDSPALQRISHLPAAQAGRPPAVPGHALPQAAQFAGSFDVFTQALPHLVVPPLQVRVHAPAVHTSPVAHDLPQPPQLDGFVAGATHTPLHAACPVGHEKLQRPPWHVDVPPAGPVQARLHAPQCPVVLARFTQRAPH
jgi:hypothetical protein